MSIIGIEIDKFTAIKIILATDLFAKQKTELRLSDCVSILTESQELINK